MKAIENPPGMKRCARCKQTKPVAEYHRARDRRDGLKPYCKACKREQAAARTEDHKIYMAAYYAANREKMLADQKAWRLAHPEEQKTRAARSHAKHRAKRTARMREYGKANRDKLNASRRAWLAANPERKRELQVYLTAYGRAAYAANPERYREYQRQRRARKLSATVGVVTDALLATKWAYWAGLCWMCGGEAVEWDHVKPLAKGGPHCLSNLRPACRSCNAQKSDAWPLAA